MIALVEGANRQKTPNEIALDVLLSSLTIIFLIVVDRASTRRPARSAPPSASPCWWRCSSA